MSYQTNRALKSPFASSYLFAAVFTLALMGLAGCAPAVMSLGSGGIAAAEYAGVKAGEKATDRKVPGPRDEQGDRCDALLDATPGVEEIRVSKNGAVESRQWRLVKDAAGAQWMFTHSKTAPPDGWEPKPGIAKLNFNPPIGGLIREDESEYLAYAPAIADSVADGARITNLTESFGPVVGTFHWHGKTYSFVLSKELPCFKAAQ